jgi:hypothetical protein
LGAWGRRTAPRGFCVDPNDAGVAGIPQFVAVLRQRNEFVERLIPSSGSCEAEG